MNKPKIIIVDEKDEIIGSKEREILDQSDIYRVSALWVQNSDGDVLLAQRKFDKKNDPGKWGPAVAGTNDEGESYESNIIKEAEEEIGLVGQSFQKSEKIRYSGKHNFFCQWFSFITDNGIEEFEIQEDEVEQIKWWERDELLEELESDPDKFIGSVRGCVDSFC
ncbi:MAG: NUDIX domain-containing protein [Candidatus Moranbacteria bacterium]|nr:NUDIX domain-containing protein [Candidatus Moranbacteria bacterium]